MKRRWAALTLVLALGLAGLPRVWAQQRPEARARNPGVILGQNYPNPFNPDTRIPFTVGDAGGCKDPNRQFKVTLRIYNLLSQPIAVPVLQDGGGGVSTGQAIEGKMLPCSQYTAYWDGQYQTLRDGKMVSTGKPVPEGIYLYRLEVDGFVIVRKMVVKR
ncbi:MAG: hypothetical protein HYX65_07220 [Gemmatimonadetes bacterium]|nr:hypothetical protein [Gemmatimonadota bacterium]